jgi:hypothetical protein
VSEAFDIVVVGSGSAGIASAAAAARAGSRTLLIDKNPAPGGTGGLSGLTTLCGLYDDAGNALNPGFPSEFAAAIAEAPPLKMGRVWVLPYLPEKFCRAAENLFSTLPGLQTSWNLPLQCVILENDRIVSLNGFKVGAVIDCSGNAEVARAVGAGCMETDETTQASAVIFQLQKVTCDLRTTAGVACALLPVARAGFAPLNLQPDPGSDSVTAKFTGKPEMVPDLIRFLREYVPGFEYCSSPVQKFSSVPRAGRMIIGEYVLTGADILAGAKFSDAVARGAWPIEQWSEEGIAKYRYLSPGEYYEIPARSLRAARVKNLFMGGKTISADVDAIASARVMGCCLATGAAAGKLAVDYLISAHQK